MKSQSRCIPTLDHNVGCNGRVAKWCCLCFLFIDSTGKRRSKSVLFMKYFYTKRVQAVGKLDKGLRCLCLWQFSMLIHNFRVTGQPNEKENGFRWTARQSIFILQWDSRTTVNNHYLVTYITLSSSTSLFEQFCHRLCCIKEH